MRGKGKQFVAPGRTVKMAFPGGGGYGDPKARNTDALKADLVGGYISAEIAAQIYGLNKDEIATILAEASKK